MFGMWLVVCVFGDDVEIYFYFDVCVWFVVVSGFGCVVGFVKDMCVVRMLVECGVDVMLVVVVDVDVKLKLLVMVVNDW